MNYSDLELLIMSSLVFYPELYDELIVDENYFIKHKRLFNYLMSFYKKFGTFDIQIMIKICKDKWHIRNYLEMLVEYEPIKYNFKKYQELLIELYNEGKKNKWIIEQIDKLTNDLYMRNVKVGDYRDKVNQIYEVADELFKND